MKALYARFIYWLIEPALKRHEEELSKKFMEPLTHIQIGIDILRLNAEQQKASTKEAGELIQKFREESKKH
jgi:hypothetical protein